MCAVSPPLLQCTVCRAMCGYRALKCYHFWSSLRGSGETNLTNIHEGAGLIPGLAQSVKDLVLPCGGVGRRCGSDPVLLWLGRKPAVTPLIDSWPENRHMLRVQPLKKKKRRKEMLPFLFKKKSPDTHQSEGKGEPKVSSHLSSQVESNNCH